MSEIPVLRDALRVTAERQVARRRRRKTLMLAGPVSAALALFAIPALRPTASEPGRQEATATPIPTIKLTTADVERQLAKTYGVFRRPARASDRPPSQSLPRRDSQAIEADPARARRIATLGERAAYVVPVLYHGQIGLCLLSRASAALPGGGGCGPFDPSRAMTKPVWSQTSASGGPVYALLLPDGVERVEIHLTSGGTAIRRVDDNGVLYQGRGVRRFSWRDADGNEYSTRATI